MTEPQGSQITRLMDGLKSSERDYRFEWTWAEISLYNGGGEIPLVAIANATRMHLIAKRSLKTSYNALDVYNERMRLPPPPPRPLVSCPAIMNPVAAKKKYAYSSDESDSNGTGSSSDSCVGDVRKRLRRYRVRKVRNARSAKYCSHSDSDSDDGEEDDVRQVKIQLKRGDDVVKVLLDRWTSEVAGKGKEKAAA